MPSRCGCGRWGRQGRVVTDDARCPADAQAAAVTQSSALGTDAREALMKPPMDRTEEEVDALSVAAGQQAQRTRSKALAATPPSDALLPRSVREFTQRNATPFFQELPDPVLRVRAQQQAATRPVSDTRAHRPLPCRSFVASWSSRRSTAAASCSARARSERAGPHRRRARKRLSPTRAPHHAPRSKFYVVLYGGVLVWADMTDKQTQLTPLELRASAAKQVRCLRSPPSAAALPAVTPRLPSPQHLDGASMVALQDDAARAAKRKARQDILMERKEREKEAKHRASAMWSSLSSRHSLPGKRSPARGSSSTVAGRQEGEEESHKQRATSRADLMIRQQRQKKQLARKASQAEGSQAWGRVGPTGEPQGGIKVREAPSQPPRVHASHRHTHHDSRLRSSLSAF